MSSTDHVCHLQMYQPELKNGFKRVFKVILRLFCTYITTHINVRPLYGMIILVHDDGPCHHLNILQNHLHCFRLGTNACVIPCKRCNVRYAVAEYLRMQTLPLFSHAIQCISSCPPESLPARKLNNRTGRCGQL